MAAPRFDRNVQWTHLDAPPNADHEVDYEYAVLGSNEATQTLDMLLRFPPGGHCTRHRHIGKTSTLVLAGEQHLYERDESGAEKHTVRRAGDYAISPGDMVHIEGGGPEGGLVFLSMQAEGGHLFDLLDEAGEVVLKVTIDSLNAS